MGEMKLFEMKMFDERIDKVSDLTRVLVGPSPWVGPSKWISIYPDDADVFEFRAGAMARKAYTQGYDNGVAHAQAMAAEAEKRGERCGFVWVERLIDALSPLIERHFSLHRKQNDPIVLKADDCLVMAKKHVKTRLRELDPTLSGRDAGSTGGRPSSVNENAAEKSCQPTSRSESVGEEE